MLEKIENEELKEFFITNFDEKKLDFIKQAVNIYLRDSNVYQVVFSKTRGVVTILSKTKQFNVNNILQICDSYEEINAIPEEWFQSIINSESESFRELN